MCMSPKQRTACSHSPACHCKHGCKGSWLLSCCHAVVLSCCHAVTCQAALPAVGGGLTSVFAHLLASLSTEGQEKYPRLLQPPSSQPEADQVKIRVPGVETLYSKIGAVYTFAGLLAGDRDFANFMEGMFGWNSPPKMFRITHSSDPAPKVTPFWSQGLSGTLVGCICACRDL